MLQTNNKRIAFVIVTIIVLMLAIAAILFFRDQPSTKLPDDSSVKTPGSPSNEEPSTPNTDNGTSQSGEYIIYSRDKLTSETNILFFHAPWCPYCREADKNINRSLDEIPEDFTIFKVDYDSNLDLRKKYGVTYQHTFIQVDKDGNLIKKWSGSYTVDELVKNAK